jgi:hypothetical protein
MLGEIGRFTAEHGLRVSRANERDSVYQARMSRQRVGSHRTDTNCGRNHRLGEHRAISWRTEAAALTSGPRLQALSGRPFRTNAQLDRCGRALRTQLASVLHGVRKHGLLYAFN